MRLIPRSGSRKLASRRRPTANLRLQLLEDRAVPAFGFGSAFNLGGAGWDYGIAIALDTSGGVYVSGMYSDTADFDPNHTNPNSNHVLTASGDYANFAAKYLADGTFQWATDLGANGQGTPAETIAVQGTTVFAGYPTAMAGGTDNVASVARLDAATGAVSWTTALTSGGTTYMGVAAGPAGGVYATGNNSASQAFVSRLDGAGNLMWTRTSSGSGTAYGSRVVVDAVGNVYATGSYTGAVTFGTTPKTSWSGSQDALVWKLDASGGVVWAGSMGSNGTDYAKGVALDGSGNLLVTGGWGAGSSTASQNNNFNPNSGTAVKLTNHGGFDIFILKLAPAMNGSLTLSWAKDIGSYGDDRGQGVAADAAGNVYSTGLFTGTVNFNPNNGKARYLSSAGGGGIFVSKLDAGGNYVQAAGMAGSTSSGGNGRAIALDGSGDVYTTGVFYGTVNFNPNGTYNLTANGGDVFLSKLTQSSPLLAASVPAAGTKVAHLTNAQLQPILAAAIDRWAVAGLDAARLDLMRHATVTIGDLGGSYLGLAYPDTHGIRIDDDAAGYGWFVDATPRGDKEFAEPNKSVQRRMDLRSVIAHELGHLVGLDHGEDAGDVMGESLGSGVRRTPTTADVTSAMAADHDAVPQVVATIASRGRHRRR
jgi:Matrixin